MLRNYVAALFHLSTAFQKQAKGRYTLCIFEQFFGFSGFQVFASFFIAYLGCKKINFQQGMKFPAKVSTVKNTKMWKPENTYGKKHVVCNKPMLENQPKEHFESNFEFQSYVTHFIRRWGNLQTSLWHSWKIEVCWNRLNFFCYNKKWINNLERSYFSTFILIL